MLLDLLNYLSAIPRPGSKLTKPGSLNGRNQLAKPKAQTLKAWIENHCVQFVAITIITNNFLPNTYKNSLINMVNTERIQEYASIVAEKSTLKSGPNHLRFVRVTGQWKDFSPPVTGHPGRVPPALEWCGDHHLSPLLLGQRPVAWRTGDPRAGPGSQAVGAHLNTWTATWSCLGCEQTGASEWI